VSAIAPATGAEFAVLPPQNATGNWVKIVQRVPVHFAIEMTPGQPALRAGMTVTVSVDTGRSRGLPEFLSWLAPWAAAK
jgi:membrane fusion protein (multidrug efflux system)